MIKFIKLFDRNRFQTKILKNFCESTDAKVNQFQYITNVFDSIKNTQCRNQKLNILEDIFRQYKQQKLINIIKIFSCQFQSPQESSELFIAKNSLINLISQYFSKPLAEVTAEFFKIGDLARIAANYYEQKGLININAADQDKVNPLLIDEIISAVQELHRVVGQGSQQKKLLILRNLFEKTTSSQEIFYLTRILEGSLKIGVSSRSVIQALKNLENEIPKEFFSALSEQIFGYQINQNQQQFEIELGVPIPSMLAKPLSKLEDLGKNFRNHDGNVICEVKYDGERSQIHFQRGKFLKLFSRNFELQNQKFQCICQDIQDYFLEREIQNCVIDGEIVLFDYKNQKILPFQQLMNKQSAQFYEEIADHTSLKLYCFDILYLNDQSLMEKSLNERLKSLRQLIKNNKKSINLVECKQFSMNDQNFQENLKELLQEKIQRGHEGLMLKSLDPCFTKYEPNSRKNWLKLKKNLIQNQSSIADTLDLVPIGGYWGKGKRASYYGAYLLATYNQLEDNFEAISKVGTGFSEQFLKDSTTFFNQKEQQLENIQNNYVIGKRLKPDVWFKPNQVWEIYTEAITLSPMYSAGVSLRFPRFLRVRKDKNYKDATSNDLIKQLYEEQNSYQ